jgi:DNA-binding protein HU-beta
MATGLTKTALIRHLAEKLEITNKQSAAGLDLLAETAIKETKKNGVFVIPGIGRLVKAERKARMGRNPQTGAGHQDQGQDRGQVPRGQGRQGRHRAPEEVASSLRTADTQRGEASGFSP